MLNFDTQIFVRRIITFSLSLSPSILFTDGSTFKLKGCILSMSFLDCNGALIPYSYESWKDDSMDSKERNSTFIVDLIVYDLWDAKLKFNC